MTAVDHAAPTMTLELPAPLRRHRRPLARRALRAVVILAVLTLFGLLVGWSWEFGSWLAVTRG